jgi:hypothetical protein
VAAKPGCGGNLELQLPVACRKIALFVHVSQSQDSLRYTIDRTLLLLLRVSSRSRNSKTHRVPTSLRWRPTASAGISQVAEGFQNILRGNSLLVPGRGAVSAPSATERETCRMRPVPILQLCYGHEIRTGQNRSPRVRIVRTGHCSQREAHWLVLPAGGIVACSNLICRGIRPWIVSRP